MDTFWTVWTALYCQAMRSFSSQCHRKSYWRPYKGRGQLLSSRFALFRFNVFKIEMKYQYADCVLMSALHDVILYDLDLFIDASPSIS
jgi:hypothetical protein